MNKARTVLLGLLLDKHVLDAHPVLRSHMLLDFFLGEPLEFFQPICVVLDISLASEYPCFHEEGLLRGNAGA